MGVIHCDWQVALSAFAKQVGTFIATWSGGESQVFKESGTWYSGVPRISDPQLERRVTKAALRLLDAGGLPALTMRVVAREAHTTTPTIYERFINRDKLLESVQHEASLEAVGAVRTARNIRDFIDRIVQFGIEHPNRCELHAAVFGLRLSGKRSILLYELLKEQLTREAGVYGMKLDQLAMAVASLTLGTTRAIIAAGSTTPSAKYLHSTCLAALQLLIQAVARQLPVDAITGQRYALEVSPVECRAQKVQQ